MRQHSAARILFCVVALPFLFQGLSPVARAANPPAVASVLDDQAWVVVRIRPERVPLVEMFRLLKFVRGLNVPERETVDSLAASFFQAGGREIYIVWDGHSPAFLFTPASEGADRVKLARAIRATDLGHFFNIDESADLTSGLAAGSTEIVERLRKLSATPREHLLSALSATDDFAIQLLLLPTDQNRESACDTPWTFVPKALSLRIVEELAWGSIGVDLAPRPRLKFVLAARDANAVAPLKGALQSLVDPTIRLARATKNLALVENLQRILAWRQDGNTLSLDVNDSNLDLTVLTRAVLQPAAELETLREAAEQSRANLKKIGIALQTHHDAYKHFPAPAILGVDDKPLLSWRVKILPFLVDSPDLYREFRQNEPWDSEHNHPLLLKMPREFRSPMSRAPAGYTHYLGVAGPGMLFEGPTGKATRNIIDGTSKTLGLVEVDDDHAVPWTQPEDWQFNSARPSAGLGGFLPGRFNAGAMDTSVHVVPIPLEPKFLQSIFTISGREPQAIPDFED